MTIKYQSGNRITGLSSDTKPTNISTNSQFTETDTRNTFYYDGTSWQQPRFENMYEVFGSPKAKNRQHFVEWFSGKQLPSYWGVIGDSNKTIEMGDSIDGGITLYAGTDNNASAGISFCDDQSNGSQNPAKVRPFSPTASKIIWVQKFAAASHYNSSQSGFSEDARPDGLGGSKSGASLVTTFWTPANKFVLRTADGTNYSGSTYTTTSQMDTNFHTFQVECLSSSCTLKIDGDLEATSTTYLPTERMAPCFGMQTTTSNSGKTYITYCEAYNT